MEAPFSFLPHSLLHRGVLAASLAVALTIALESTCRNEVRKLWTFNKRLYVSAVWTNLFNNLVLGPLTYYVAIRYFCQPPGVLSGTEQLQAVLGIVLIEAVLYYAIHKAFHEVKGLFWMHSYHHKFNTVVLPSSANAVSVAEYGTAYMLPLVVGVVVTRADELAAFAGSAVVGVANVLIHTPWLAAHPDHDNNPETNDYYCFPWFLVTAGDHFSHHRKMKGNYGAPVLHLDRIVERCSSVQKSQAPAASVKAGSSG